MWISRKHFTDKVSFEEKMAIQKKYDSWSQTMSLLGSKNKISPNAIKLAEKMKEQLDIDVFPSIMITARKGWMSQGTPNFCMNDKRGHSYFFFDTPSRYLRKKINWVLGDDNEVYMNN